MRSPTFAKSQSMPEDLALTRDRRSVDSVELILQKMAQKVGHIYGVEISVRRLEANGPHGAQLIFVNDANEPILDDDEAIPACNAEEIESGDFMKLFAARSLYAALTQRFIEADL